MYANAQPRVDPRYNRDRKIHFLNSSQSSSTVYAMVLKTYNKLAIKHCPGNKTFRDRAQQSLLPSLYVSKKSEEEEKAPILVVAAQ